MILALNLNCSLDKIYTVDHLDYGGVVRAKRTQNTAGGKGLHIANICNLLDEDYLVTGFLGGHTGNLIQDILDKNHTRHDFVTITGETRSCINIGTPDGKQTEVLEAGPVIHEEEQHAFLEKYDELLKKTSIVVGSGSIPQGVAKDFYGLLIDRAKKAGKHFLLDTSGEALLAALPHQPFLIKPNKDEMEALTGKKIQRVEDAAAEAKKFLKEGISLPVISLGKEGSVIGWQDTIYHAQPPMYKAVNAVGSGDAFVAGIAIGLMHELSILDVIRLGSACGTANVLEAESGYVDPKKVKKIFQEVKVSEL